MSDRVKVILLEVEPGGRRLFHAEPLEDEDPSRLPQHKGIRGWFETKVRSLKAAVQHSESRAARWSRGVWDRLQRTTHPDETLLARLRATRAIEVHYPTTLSHDEAVAAWAAFLVGSRRRHWPWFLVNLIVSPLTLILGPIPGPNLVGYWIAYRAIHHGLILLGLGQARSGRIEMTFNPNPTLNREGGISEEAAIEGVDPVALGEFLRRHGARSP